MCNAQGAGMLGAATTFIGGAMDYGAIESEANFNQGVARENERLALRAEGDALAQGQQEEAIQRLKSGELAATQRAAYAASGVDVSSGSALDVLAGTAAMGELDAQTVRSNAAREAFGFQAQRKQIRTQSMLDQRRADEAKVKTILGTFSSTWSQMMGSAGSSMGKR